MAPAIGSTHRKAAIEVQSRIGAGRGRDIMRMTMHSNTLQARAGAAGASHCHGRGWPPYRVRLRLLRRPHRLRHRRHRRRQAAQTPCWMPTTNAANLLARRCACARMRQTIAAALVRVCAGEDSYSPLHAPAGPWQTECAERPHLCGWVEEQQSVEVAHVSTVSVSVLLLKFHSA